MRVVFSAMVYTVKGSLPFAFRFLSFFLSCYSEPAFSQTSSSSSRSGRERTLIFFFWCGQVSSAVRCDF